MGAKKPKRLWPYAAGALGGAGLILIVLWWPETVRLADEHPGLAGWMQAIFSVVAIVGAYALGERQAEHARRLATIQSDEDRREKARAEAAEDLAWQRRSIEIATLSAYRVRSAEKNLPKVVGLLGATQLRTAIANDLRGAQSFPLWTMRNVLQINQFLAVVGVLSAAEACILAMEEQIRSGLSAEQFAKLKAEMVTNLAQLRETGDARYEDLRSITDPAAVREADRVVMVYNSGDPLNQTG